jgi:hypothetical protein
MRIKDNIAVSASGLIFNPDTGESFTVNPMGAEIISKLKEGKDQKAIVAETAEKYFVQETAFENDLEDFFGLLRNYLLVEND